MFDMVIAHMRLLNDSILQSNSCIESIVSNLRSFESSSNVFYVVGVNFGNSSMFVCMTGETLRQVARDTAARICARVVNLVDRPEGRAIIKRNPTETDRNRHNTTAKM